MGNVETKLLLKAVLMYLLYFVYSLLTSQITVALNLGDTTIVSFVGDFLFTVIIIAVYWADLKNDAKDLKEKFTFKKIIGRILLGIGAIMLMRIVMGVLTELIAPGISVDSNTASILDLLNAQSDLASARYEHISAQHNWFTTRANLVRAIGQMSLEEIENITNASNLDGISNPDIQTNDNKK